MYPDCWRAQDRVNGEKTHHDTCWSNWFTGFIPLLFRFYSALLKQSEECNKTSSPQKTNRTGKNNSKQLFQDSKSQSGTKKELRSVYSWKSVRTLDDKSGSLQRVCSPLAWICSSLIPPPKAWSVKQSYQSRTAHEKQQLHCYRALTWFGWRAKTRPWQHYQ